MRLAISMISVVVAVGVGMTAATVLFTSGPPAVARFGLGAFMSLYAVAAVSILVLAWRSRSRKWPGLAAMMSAAFTLIWIIIIGSFDYGMISGLEVVGATLVALAATINWYAVRLVVDFGPPNTACSRRRPVKS